MNTESRNSLPPSPPDGNRLPAELELLALECLIGLALAVLFLNLQLEHQRVMMVIAILSIGLVDGSSRLPIKTRLFSLCVSVAIFVKVSSLTMHYGSSLSDGPLISLFFFLFLFLVHLFPTVLVSLSARPILAAAARLFHWGPDAVTRINKIIRATALTVGSLSILWVAIKHLFMS